MLLCLALTAKRREITGHFLPSRRRVSSARRRSLPHEVARATVAIAPAIFPKRAHMLHARALKCSIADIFWLLTRRCIIVSIYGGQATLAVSFLRRIVSLTLMRFVFKKDKLPDA